MVEWLKANGGWPSLVVIGLGVLGVTSVWGGVALIAIGGAGFAGQQLRRLLNRKESRHEESPAPELATPEHREAVRTVLQGISHHVQADRVDPIGGPWSLAIDAHYPQLAEMLTVWNPVAERRVNAPKRLADRFDTEIKALDLGDDFHVQTIIDGFAVLTARRALRGELGVKLSRPQLWDVWRVTSAPLDGVRLKAAQEVAITMPVVPEVSNEDFNAMAGELIDQIEPTFWVAQDWPEAREVAEADQALSEFDRKSIFDEIDRLNTPERIRVSPACPVCGVVG